MLSQRRISRTLVVIFLLTFVQTVVAPIANFGTPSASAATLFDNKSNFLQWTNWQSVTTNHAPFKTSAGTAEITSNADSINLTQNVGSQVGFLWNTQPVSYSRDFSVSGNYFFGTTDGADGIVFSMRDLGDWANDGVLGSSTGGASAFLGSKEIRVFFDTFANGSEIADDHLTVASLNSSGAVTNYTNNGNGIALKNSSGATVADVENNAVWPFTIKWTASTRTLSVFAGLNANYQFFTTTITATEQDASQFYWGWAGLTGGAFNYQALSDVTYHLGPVVSTTSTDTTVIDGGSVTLNASYSSSEASPTTRWEYSTDGGSTWTSTGISTNSYTFTATRAMNQRKYRFYVESTAAGSTFSQTTTPLTLTVIPPYLMSDTDTALTTSGTKYATISNSNSLIPGTVSTVSLEAWIKPSTTCDGAVACTIMTIDKSFLVQVVSGKIRYYIGSGSAYCDGGVGKDVAGALTPGGEWSHVGFVRVNANVKIYINGVLRSDINSSCSPTTQAANTNAFVVGAKGLNSEPFIGSIDEVRIWNVDRTSNIASDMNSNETSTAGLLTYWNFNEGTGTTAYNQVPGATSSSDLTITDATIWDSTVVSDVNSSNAYTTRTFYRTYITANGGWRIPSTVSSLSALIVGGGGGGGYNSGGGGSGGGVLTQGRLLLSGIQAVSVGVGGAGASSTGSAPTVGGNSKFAITTVQGGNPGGNYPASQTGGAGITTSSGTSGAGGTGAPNNSSSGTAGGTGVTSYVTTPSQTFGGGGGGGGWANVTGGGAGGSGGGGAGGITNSQNGKSGTTNTGGGGGAGSASGTIGGSGGSGVIVVRWITASKPIFTQPTIDTTTAGLTDTITVSANPLSPLIRNYRWQSSSDTGTTWVNISTGSGFTSQTYTTPTLETTTSGIRYQYRVVVTDSDTAGLSITDTSTAVYIIINPRIVITGSYTLQKYGATHVDTFTTVAGTGTGSETFTFSPNNRSGITWNGSTANQATLTIARTLGPGTYYETMTATDTKGATTQLGIAIVVSKADTITVTSLARTDTYTSNTLTFTPGYTATGLQNSDTVTSISWSYSGTENSFSPYGPSATKPINAGSYIITPSAVISNVDSYTAVVYETSTLTVNRATRTITASVSPSPLKFGATGALSATPSGGSGDGVVTYSTSTTDSCTVSSANLQALKSTGTCSFTARISRGNNYETATSTSATVSLAKADTLTVFVNAITPVTYTGYPAAVSPTVTVSGLALSNSVGSSPVTFSYVGQGNVGPTCAQGGACSVGDTGPGGGIVFYVAATQQSWGRYLEAAPANWSGGADNQASNIGKWCVATPSVDSTVFTGLYDGFGYGYINTYDTRLNVCTGGAINKARSYRGGGFTNWYLPNNTELTIMADPTIRTMIGLVNDSSLWGYWGSQEAQNTGYIGSLVTPYWTIGATVKGETAKNMTRPIRAFSQGEVATLTYSSPPTDAGTYTVKASSLTLSSGSLSDYQGVSYTDGTLLINRAQQSPLVIAQYAAFFGTPYKVLIFGGSGAGVLTETVTAGTATGCTLNGDTLTTTSVGTCQLTATKAQDRNYETATAIAFVYFVNYLINQPTATPSTPNEIAISGATSLSVSTTSPPSITNLSTLALSIAAGGTFTITGTGFGASGLTVKFWRNKIVSPTGSTATSITFNVSDIGTAGATSGRITVITVNGQDFSTDSLTITP
jgi:Concanavalin A-like lectin/glucanases superfamily